MAACGSLQHIFEKPLPENPTLLESLSSWNNIKSMKPIEDSSFTEIFGELHFKESTHNHADQSPLSSPPLPLSSSPSSSLSSSSLYADLVNSPSCRTERLYKDTTDPSSSNDRSKSPTPSYQPGGDRRQYRHSDSFSSMNSESLSLCTEGLGFESSDDVEDLRNDNINNDWQYQEDRTSSTIRHSISESQCSESKRSRTSKGAFPPPISCIGRSGKPWVWFKSYREDGRFILKEIRIPTQEFLHACREHGRLRLRFIQSDDDLEDEEEEYDDLEDIEEVNEDRSDEDNDCKRELDDENEEEEEENDDLDNSE